MREGHITRAAEKKRPKNRCGSIKSGSGNGNIFSIWVMGDFRRTSWRQLETYLAHTRRGPEINEDKDT